MERYFCSDEVLIRIRSLWAREAALSMTSTTGTLKPKIPFAEVKASKAFMHEAQLLLLREIARQSSRLVSESNTQTFYHGRTWNYQREGRDGFTPQSGRLELHQEKLTVGIDRLFANDVTVLPDLILGFGEQVSSHQAKSVANELNAVVEETGNTIQVPKDGSMADAFLESLKRCVWSVDSKGNVHPPHILLDAESQIRLHKEISERGETFQQQFEEVKRTQEAAARSAEEIRLKKYDVEE
jgi:hypothetical protein